MGLFSHFEDKMEDTLEGTANKMAKSPLSPIRIAQKAEKMMRREKMVGAGKQYAPTLYTVLVNCDDDARLFNYYPTLAGETETYLKAKAAEQGLVMDGNPLVRFIVDDSLRHGKFDIIAEPVAAPIIEKLRDEEMERYGIAPARNHNRYDNRPQTNRPQASRRPQNAYDANPNYDYDDGNYDDYADFGSYNEPAYEEPPVEDSNRTQRFAPTQAAPASAKPVNTDAVLVDVQTNRAYRLTKSRMIVGRERSGSDIVINDPSASRMHAELRFDGQGNWTITDLGSTNGTIVGGQPVTSAPLHDGCEITIGETPLLFTQD